MQECQQSTSVRIRNTSAHNISAHSLDASAHNLDASAHVRNCNLDALTRVHNQLDASARDEVSYFVVVVE